MPRSLALNSECTRSLPRSAFCPLHTELPFCACIQPPLPLVTTAHILTPDISVDLVFVYSLSVCGSRHSADSAAEYAKHEANFTVHVLRREELR